MMDTPNLDSILSPENFPPCDADAGAARAELSALKQRAEDYRMIAVLLLMPEGECPLVKDEDGGWMLDLALLRLEDRDDLGCLQLGMDDGTGLPLLTPEARAELDKK